MMVLSFYWGQKYYKVNYQLKNALMYFALSLALFFISKYLRPESQTMVYVFNTFLLAIFIATFSIKEKVWLLLKK